MIMGLLQPEGRERTNMVCSLGQVGNHLGSKTTAVPRTWSSPSS